MKKECELLQSSLLSEHNEQMSSVQNLKEKSVDMGLIFKVEYMSKELYTKQFSGHCQGFEEDGDS